MNNSIGVFKKLIKYIKGNKDIKNNADRYNVVKSLLHSQGLYYISEVNKQIKIDLAFKEDLKEKEYSSVFISQSRDIFVDLNKGYQKKILIKKFYKDVLSNKVIKYLERNIEKLRNSVIIILVFINNDEKNKLDDEQELIVKCPNIDILINKSKEWRNSQNGITIKLPKSLDNMKSILKSGNRIWRNEVKSIFNKSNKNNDRNNKNSNIKSEYIYNVDIGKVEINSENVLGLNKIYKNNKKLVKELKRFAIDIFPYYLYVDSSKEPEFFDNDIIKPIERWIGEQF